MQIRELQEYLSDRLNAVEALVQGGCRAFAEDTRTVYDESAQFGRTPQSVRQLFQDVVRHLVAALF